MSDAVRLDELLLKWEEHWEAGQPISAEILCADQAALLPELRRRIELLQRFRQIAAPKPCAEALPVNLGRYAVKRELGRGISGVVYLAKDRELRRKVAVKVLRPPLGLFTAEEGRRLGKRFEREARTLANLYHESVVSIYEAHLGEGEPYFVMEYMPGGSLKSRVGDAAGDPARIAAFMARVAAAVQYAHANGVLHRDLKPANILLNMDGRPKVSDFGLAKLLDDALLERADSSILQAAPKLEAEDSTLTLPGRQPGTPAYMAPEQFDARWGPVGLPADVWALGAILYEMLAGHRPFSGERRLELQRRICHEPPAPANRGNRPVDPALQRLALRCLDKDPARRPTVAALTDALARYRSPGPIRRLAGAAIGVCRPLWGLFARAPGTPARRTEPR